MELSVRQTTWENVRFFKIIFLIYLLTISALNANINKKIIDKIINTESFSFQFKQQINNKIEKGNCKIKYPKLMLCDYDDSYQKRLIANGKRLVIIQRRYKKIFYYSIKKTPLNLILDKNFLVDIIKNNQPSKIDDQIIEFSIYIDDSKKLILIFDKFSLNLRGWRASDIYNDVVEFFITDLKTNIKIDEKIFRIPNEEEL